MQAGIGDQARTTVNELFHLRQKGHTSVVCRRKSGQRTGPASDEAGPVGLIFCAIGLIFCKSVYQVIYQLLILYHFTAYFMDVLSYRLSVTPYFVIHGIM